MALCYTRRKMPQLLASILDTVRPNTLLDIGLTALLFYGLFSLIRGTRAVRLVIGVIVLVVIYLAAQLLALRLLTQILQAGAVVGLLAVVVIFQPELRRGLERIGRVGSFGWLAAAEHTQADEVAAKVARAAARLSGDGHGALIVIERDTGLEEIAETGVMIHGDLSVDLLRSIFMPRTALHDGAVIIREGGVLAAGALLPLAEMTVHTERFGTRHRAALGITEQTDAVVVVVSEENRQVSLVERARIVRNLGELQLARALRALLDPSVDRSGNPVRPAAATRQLLGGAGRLMGRARAADRESGDGAASAARDPSMTPMPRGDGAPDRSAPTPATEPATRAGGSPDPDSTRQASPGPGANRRPSPTTHPSGGAPSDPAAPDPAASGPAGSDPGASTAAASAHPTPTG